MEHVSSVSENLEAVGVAVEVLRALDGKDVTDHLAAGHSMEDLVRIEPGEELRRLQLPKSPAKRFADVAMKPVEWLWTGYIPAGKVTMLDGDPGIGKTAIALDLCARLTNGQLMPDGTGCDAGAIIYCSVEDDVDDTLAPRIHAAGVNMQKAHYLSEIGGVFLNLTEHARHIEAAIIETGARLVVIDHLFGLATGIDMVGDPGAVSAVMKTLKDIAGRTGAAFLVLRHNVKSREGKAQNRGSGSVQIAAAARSGLMVDRPGDPQAEIQENPQLAQYKSSVGQVRTNLEYRLEERIIDNPANPEQKISTVVVKWLGATSLRADQLNAQRSGANKREATPNQVNADEFLLAQLAKAESMGTGVEVRALKARGLDVGLSKHALHDAFHRLDVKSSGPRGKGGTAVWWMEPDQADLEL